MRVYKIMVDNVSLPIYHLTYTEAVAKVAELKRDKIYKLIKIIKEE